MRDALRLGCLQLLFLDGVAPHAAVDQSVELVKSAAGSAARGAGLVNAVLRRAAREGSGLIASLDDTTPRGAALRHSVPDWLATMWWDTLGAADARALLARINEPAEASLRVNTLVATPAEVLAQLTARGVPVRPAAGALDGDRQTIGESSPAHAGAAAADASLPEGLLLDGAFAVTADPLWASGALVAQSRAAMHAARLLAPAPGMRVLDLCAAPGGKATHLAALIEGSGEIVAVERHPGRARALRETCTRLHAASVRVEVGDAAVPREDGPFDAVLVDPPCSGLGTLQGRPDLRWRMRKNTLPALAALQQRILAAGASGAASRRDAALRHVHDLPPGERRRRARRAGDPSRARARRSRRVPSRDRLRRRAASTPAAAASRRHGRLLPRPPAAPLLTSCQERATAPIVQRPSAGCAITERCVGQGHERAGGRSRTRVPRLPRAVAAPHDDARAATAASTACAATSSSPSAPTAASTRRSCACRARRSSCATTARESMLTPV